MSVKCFVFGSYTASCRPLVLRGNKTAEGWLEPSLQKAGFSLGRILEVIQTRPCASNIGLWTLAWLCQMASSPQYGEGDRKSTRLNSSHSQISYAVFCLKKKKKK